MLLFCTVVGVLPSWVVPGVLGLLAHAVHSQLNRQTTRDARPIISDMIAEPDAQDINRLDLPGEFFGAAGLSAMSSSNPGICLLPLI